MSNSRSTQFIGNRLNTSLLTEAAATLEAEESTEELMRQARIAKAESENTKKMKLFFATQQSLQDEKIAQLQRAIANEKQIHSDLQVAIDEIRAASSFTNTNK